MPSDLPMGKDIGKVLKAGKAFKGALVEAKNGRGSSKAIDLEVPLKTEFCGTTLQKLMKKEGLTREDATAVYLAWKQSCDQQGLPSGPVPKQKPSKLLKGEAADAGEPKTRVRGKGSPPNKHPAPESDSTKPSKKRAKTCSGDDQSLLFAPANAQDVADFFGTEKEKVLKKQKSTDLAEDLDGEPWDETEGWGEEWGDEDWDKSGDWWEGSTEEYDWEAEYPGFWDDYWEHKYGERLETKLSDILAEQASSPTAGPTKAMEGPTSRTTGPQEGTMEGRTSPTAGPQEGTMEGATNPTAGPEERTAEPAAAARNNPSMPHDPSQDETQVMDDESVLSLICILAQA